MLFEGCDVHAIDISSAALSKAKEKVEHYGLSDRIHIYNRSVLDPLPFPPGYFDLVLDSYVFCHFLGNDRENYRRNVQTLTRSGGSLIVSAFPPEDGYYGTMSRPHESLQGRTPAEACGIEIQGDNKWITLTQNAKLNTLRNDGRIA